MTRSQLLAAAAFLVGGTSLVFAQAPAQPDLDKAKQIVSQICVACHGADGASPTSANPSLAGLPADYITLQLAHFKAGIRVNPVMQGMVATLNDADMRSLGVYFSRQKPKAMEAKDAALVRSGQALWRAGDAASGTPACSACHGPNGAGIPKSYPRLAGQWADYTYAQLKAFKGGERGADAGGKDQTGRIMAAVARGMSDAQMKAVAEYAQGLR
ncbi:MAG: c-type cytochrome [Burkholderiales bacterium]